MSWEIMNKKVFAVVAAASLLASGVTVTTFAQPAPAFAKTQRLAKPKIKKIKNTTYYVGAVIKVKGKHMKNINKVAVGNKTAKVTKKLARTSSSRCRA